MMEYVCIDIYYEWSAWMPWDVIATFKKHQVRGPIPAQPGVYEIRRTDSVDPDERLYIGSSKRLTTRVYGDLMNDQGGKNATHKKQAFLDEVGGHTDLLALRWATAEEYLALEHYLHRRYVAHYGRLPNMFCAKLEHFSLLYFDQRLTIILTWPTGYATSEPGGGESPEKLAKTAEMCLPERKRVRKGGEEDD